MKYTLVTGSVPVDRAQRVYIPARIRQEMGWTKETQNPFVFVEGILIFYPNQHQDIMHKVIEFIQAETAKKLEESE